MIGSDKEGLFGYLCPSCKKYFRANYKIKKTVICPYCLKIDDSLNFLTDNQKKYVGLYYNASIEHFNTGKEVQIDLDFLISKLDNNIIKLNEYEQKQQKIINCELCEIKFDVIGVYASCPGCGKRNNLDNFIEEINKIKKLVNEGVIDLNSSLNMSIEHYDGFGSDVKNILLKNIPLTKGNKEKVEKLSFQRISDANKILKDTFNLNLFINENEKNELHVFFQKRHLIAHKSSVVDETYIKNTGDTTLRIGQKISIKKPEIDKFFILILKNIEEFSKQLHLLLFNYIEKYNK